MSSLEWTLIRATGMTAVVLLTGAMVLGLMLSLRLRTPRWPGAVTSEVHRYVTALALVMTGAHLALLLVDSQAGISLVNLVVPFTAPTQTFAVGLGTIATLTLGLLWWTSVNRRRIGHARWRRVHHLAFVAYVMAMGHGLLNGTDTAQRWAWPVYVASALLVGGLTAARIQSSRAERVPAATRTPTRQRPATHSATAVSHTIPATLPPLERSTPPTRRTRPPVRL